MSSRFTAFAYDHPTCHEPDLSRDEYADDSIVDLLTIACDDRNFGRYLGRSTCDQEV